MQRCMQNRRRVSLWKAQSLTSLARYHRSPTHSAQKVAQRSMPCWQESHQCYQAHSLCHSRCCGYGDESDCRVSKSQFCAQVEDMLSRIRCILENCRYQLELQVPIDMQCKHMTGICELLPCTDRVPSKCTILIDHASYNNSSSADAEPSSFHLDI